MYLLIQCLRDEQGQDIVEYSLLIAFIIFVAIGLAIGMSQSIADITGNTKSELDAGAAFANS